MQKFYKQLSQLYKLLSKVSHWSSCLVNLFMFQMASLYDTKTSFTENVILRNFVKFAHGSRDLSPG